MRKTLGERRDWTALNEGTIYRVTVPALGTVNARLVDKKNLTFEVTDGYLQSQADKKKRWNKGQAFEVMPGMFEAWEIQ